MKKLLIYKDGSEYIVGGVASIDPNGLEPTREYDISHFSKDELESLAQNKKDTKLLKLAKKIK